MAILITYIFTYFGKDWQRWDCAPAGNCYVSKQTYWDCKNLL